MFLFFVVILLANVVWTHAAMAVMERLGNVPRLTQRDVNLYTMQWRAALLIIPAIETVLLALAVPLVAYVLGPYIAVALPTVGILWLNHRAKPEDRASSWWFIPRYCSAAAVLLKLGAAPGHWLLGLLGAYLFGVGMNALYLAWIHLLRRVGSLPEK